VKRLGFCITGATIIFLLASFIDPAVFQGRQFDWNTKTAIFVVACLAPILLSSLVFLFLIFRSENGKSITRAALLVLLFSFLARVAWISMFDSYQVNDFGAYLGCAQDVVSSGNPSASNLCGGAEEAYWRRTAVYTYPIVLLFGPSLLALKLVNVCLATLSGLFFYLSGKSIFGARASAAALLFFIWHPDLWYAMTLASHDLPAIFWLSVFFFISIRLRQRLLKPPYAYAAICAHSAAIGVLLFLLGMTHSYQYGAILALGGCTLIHVVLLFISRSGEANDIAQSFLYPRDAGFLKSAQIAAIHIFFLIAMPLLVYAAGAQLFARFAAPAELRASSGGFTCYVSSIDVLGTTNYDEIANWLSQCPNIPPRERTAFAVRKVLHDMTHDPGQYLLHLVRKNRVLNQADDYLFWATSNEHEPWDKTYDQVKRINRFNLDKQATAIYIAHVILLLFVSWRLLLFPTLPFRMAEGIPIIFSATYLGIFLFLLESQGRYEIFLAFIFSWMAGQAVVDIHGRLHGRAASAKLHCRNPRWLVFAGGALCLSLLIGVYWLAAKIVADSYFTLRDQSGFTAVPEGKILDPDFAGLQIAPVFVSNNHKQLMLAYPAGVAVAPGTIMAVERSFRIHPNSRHHLRFFLSTKAATVEPYAQKIPWNDVDLKYLILANGYPIARGNLGNIQDNLYISVYQKLGLNFGSSVKLQFLIKNGSQIDRVGLDRGPVVALEYLDLQ
jgi:hypothetical protein